VLATNPGRHTKINKIDNISGAEYKELCPIIWNPNIMAMKFIMKRITSIKFGWWWILQFCLNGRRNLIALSLADKYRVIDMRIMLNELAMNMGSSTKKRHA